MILIIGTTLEVRELDLAPGVECEIETAMAASIKLKTVAMRPDCLTVYLPKELEVAIPESVMSKVQRFDSDEHLQALLSGKDGVSTPSEPAPAPEPKAQEEKSEVTDEKKEAVAETVKKPVEKVEAQVEKETVKEEKADVKEEILKGTKEVVESIKQPTDIQFDEVDTLDSVYNTQMTEVDVSLPDDFVTIPMEDTEDMTQQQLEAKEKIIQQKDVMIQDLKTERDDLLARHKNAIDEIKKANDKKEADYNKVINQYKSEIDKAKGIVSSDIVKRATMYAANPKVAIKEGYTEETKFNSSFYTIACNTHEDMGYIAKRMNKFIEEGCLIVDFTGDYVVSSLIHKNIDNKQSKDRNSLKLLNGGSVEDNAVDINENTKIVLSDICHDIVFLNTNWLEVLKKLDGYANGRDIVLLFGSMKSFCVAHAVSVLTSLTNTAIFVRSSPLNIQSLYCTLRFVPNLKNQQLKIIAVECVDKVKHLLTQIGNTRKVIMMDSISSDKLYEVVKQ